MSIINHCRPKWLTTAIMFTLCSLASSLILPGCKEDTTTTTTTTTVVENLSDPAIMPQVKSALPAPGSVGPYNLYNRGDGNNRPFFILTFNKLMFKGSFTYKSFKITGFTRPVIARVEGTYYYAETRKTSSTQSIYYDNVLSFFIVDSLYYYGMSVNYAIGQQYTITLDSSVEDINGNHLTAPYTFSFTPEPNFRVVSMWPKNGSVDNFVQLTPYMLFNSTVNSSIFSQLQLSPAPPGRWVIDSYDSMGVFYPTDQSMFPFNTSFTMSVSSSATDAAQHKIDREYTSAFSTIAFRVVSISPRNGTKKVELGSSIYVDFSGQIDTGTVRNGFSISPAIEGYFSMYPPTSMFYFYPLNGYRQNTTYTVSISAGLLSSTGIPATPMTSQFTTDAFRLTSAYPPDGSTGNSRMTTISISFNAPLEGSTVTSSISISPPVTGYFSYSDGNSNVYFYPTVQMDANRKYTVTISTGLATKRGDHLPTPATFSFTTGSY